MSVLSLTYGPYSQAGGPQTIALTNTQRGKFNHSIALKFTDSSGAVVVPAGGSMSAYARREGGSLFEAMDMTSIDISKVGGWPYTEDPIDSIRVEPTGLDAGLQYYVVINSLGWT